MIKYLDQLESCFQTVHVCVTDWLWPHRETSHTFNYPSVLWRQRRAGTLVRLGLLLVTGHPGRGLRSWEIPWDSRQQQTAGTFCHSASAVPSSSRPQSHCLPYNWPQRQKDNLDGIIPPSSTFSQVFKHTWLSFWDSPAPGSSFHPVSFVTHKEIQRADLNGRQTTNDGTPGLLAPREIQIQILTIGYELDFEKKKKNNHKATLWGGWQQHLDFTNNNVKPVQLQQNQSL